MFLSSTNVSRCPNTTEDWLSNISKFTLTSNPSPYFEQPIKVYPFIIPAKTSGFAYNLTNFAFNMTSTSLSAAASGTVGLSFKAELRSCYLYSNTPVTGARYDDVRGLTSDIYTTGQLQLLKGPNSTILQLDFPSIFMNLTTVSYVTIVNQNWSAVTSAFVSGRFLLQAELSCSQGCGDHGRCVVVNGVAACQCECGWAADSSGACTLAQGYCPIFGDVQNSTVTVAASPTQTPPPGSSPSPPSPGSDVVCSSPPASNTSSSDYDSRPLTVASSAGTCPSGYDLDSRGILCSRCAYGFDGSGCKFCQSDLACQIAYNSSSASCKRGPVYLEKSQEKNYKCAIQDAGVSTLLGTTIGFSCSTVRPANSTTYVATGLTGGAGLTTAVISPVGSTPNCAISFRLVGMPAPQGVKCTAWGCQFGRDTTNVECSTTTCECPNGCTTSDGTDWYQTFKAVSGGAKMQCDSNAELDASCSLVISGIPISAIPLTCNTTECYNPGANATVGYVNATSGGSTAAYQPVIAAIPLMVQALVLLLCCAALAAALPFIHGQVTSPSNGKSAAYAVNGTPEPVNAQGRAGPVAEGHEGAGMAGYCSSGAVGQLEQGHQGARLSGGLVMAQMEQKRELRFADIVVATSSSPLGGVASRMRRRADFRHHATHLSSSASAAAAAHAGGAAHAQNGDAEAPIPAGNASLYGNSAAAAASAAAGAGSGMAGRGAAGMLRGHKVILHGLSGAARTGEVVGILGPSGSGKSTLLNVLAGQIQDGGRWEVTGDVLLDGRPVPGKLLPKLTAHVPQHDLLLRSLSVEECLRYSATIRLGRAASPQSASERVDQVLRELRLSHIRHQQGSSGSMTQISGGERQRVSIGMELVTDPHILLLDEPTSGLDSYNARGVLTCLREVAGAGRIVVTSLHQPSPALFAMLDQALLIARGHMVFTGPPGTAADAFAAYGLPCPPDTFIAEYMLEAVGDPDTCGRLLDAVVNGKGPMTAASPAAAAAPAGPDRPSASPGSKGPQQPWGRSPSSALVASPRKQQPWRELGVVFWRSLADVLRNPALALMHVVVAVVLGLLVGFVYYQQDNDTSGAQNRVGSIFFSMNLFAFLSISAIDLIQPEKQVVEREMLRHYYTPSTYMVTKLLLDGLCLRAFPTIIFCILYYWLMGLRASAQAFFVFTWVFVTFVCLAGAMCLAACALLPSPGSAVVVSNLLLLVWALFSGFLANKSSITWVLRWITYVSPFRFAWEALVVNELGPMTLRLTAPDLPPVPDIQGRLFLGILGVDPDALTTNIIVLNCMYLAMVLIAIACMAVRLRLVRRGWA